MLEDYIGRGSFRRLRRFLPPGQEYCQFAYARKIAALVRQETRWLDAGCGHQILERRLHKEELALVGKARLAAGCDAYLPALARHRSLQNLVRCSIEHLPFKDRAFDLVTLNMVVEHLNRPEEFFRELSRIVDSGGRVVLLTPNAGGYYVFLIRIGWRIVPRRVGLKMVRYLEHREPEDVFPTHYEANTIRRIRSLMRRQGFAEEQVLPSFDRPFFYFFLPLSVAELIAVRLLWRLGCKGVAASTIIGVYRRTPEGNGLNDKHSEVKTK